MNIVILYHIAARDRLNTVLEYELRQAMMNESYYRRVKHEVNQAQAKGTLLEDAFLARQLKTTITRLLNQAIRLNTLNSKDLDYAVLNQIRMQNTDRVEELLKIWEPIEQYATRKKVAQRRATAIANMETMI
jgi:3-oxoacyl-[acyl-carrier-protein] synthase III